MADQGFNESGISKDLILVGESLKFPLDPTVY